MAGSMTYLDDYGQYDDYDQDQGTCYECGVDGSVAVIYDGDPDRYEELCAPCLYERTTPEPADEYDDDDRYRDGREWWEGPFNWEGYDGEDE